MLIPSSLSDSLRECNRIFMGKNKVAQIAFGRSPEDEYKTNLRNISNVSVLIAIFCLERFSAGTEQASYALFCLSSV